MADKDIQVQIDEINVKLDAILECATAQKLRSERMDDLMEDVNIIARDAFRSSVEELEKQGVELNWDDIKFLVFKLMKNVNKISAVIDTFESMYDLMQDLGPVAREVIIDVIRKMHVLEQKGYFEFFGAMATIMDNIVTNYSKEDVELLADNIVTIMETIKSMTQPEMMKALNNALNIYHKLDVEDIPEYSMWKAMKELRTPEMKRGMGFIITFLKNLSEENVEAIKN
jgi:uncharacterized protein YjgD (DUF1641 family)